MDSIVPNLCIIHRQFITDWSYPSYDIVNLLSGLRFKVSTIGRSICEKQVRMFAERTAPIPSFALMAFSTLRRLANCHFLGARQLRPNQSTDSWQQPKLFLSIAGSAHPVPTKECSARNCKITSMQSWRDSFIVVGKRNFPVGWFRRLFTMLLSRYTYRCVYCFWYRVDINPT